MSGGSAELYEGFDALILPRCYGGLGLPLNQALISGPPAIMSNTSPNNAILPRDWLVPGAFNGGFTFRVPIQYCNVNIAVMAAKLDDWATMPDEVLDQQKTRALELSRQWNPEALRPQYEAVLAGCRPMALAPRSLQVVSIYERGIRKLLHGDTALLSERTSDRHQSFLGERLKVCFALPDFSGIYASGDVSQHMRDEARRRVSADVQALADFFGILSRNPWKFLSQ